MLGGAALSVTGAVTALASLLRGPVTAWAALAGVGLMIAGTLVCSAERLRRQALADARQAAQEQRTASLLGMATDVCCELDAQGRVRKLFESSRRDGAALGPSDLDRKLWELPGVVIDAAALRALRDDLRLGQGWRELPLQRSDAEGRLRHLRLSAEPRRDGGGPLGGHWAMLRDVTVEVQAREALQISESRFHDLFRRIPTALVVHRGGRVLDANPAAVAMFGFGDLASMVGQDLLSFYAPGASQDLARQRLGELAALPPGRRLPPAEFMLRPRPGIELVVQASSVTVDAGEDRSATLTIYVDETERRQADAAVQRSEAMLSLLVANNPDLITLTEMATGRYVMVNPSFERMTGYTIAEAMGKTSLELGIWADNDARRRLVEALHRAPAVQNLPTSFVTRRGARVTMLMSAARFMMDEREYLLISARDVTAAEQARLEREAILDNAQAGICLIRDEHFMMVNPRLEQMLGWPPGLLVGQHAAVVWPSRENYDETGRRIGPPLARSERVEIEQALRRRDGSQFLCRLLAKAVDPNHPSRGGTIWLAEDITERRQVEQALARARDDAEAASHAKSAFLANTSHEIRTPLNALLGLARLARHPALEDSRRRQYIEQISESAETLSGILSDILDLSKIEAGKMHLDRIVFDLGALLTSLHHAYSALADTKGLDFEVERDEGLPEAVVGDPTRVRQILSNYLNNALKFTDSGRLRLSARSVRPGLVRFEVTDTGPGIDAETQARLFSPFTQADNSVTRSYGGTGLGLSICRELAELMGGQVGVVSLPGQGSCFWADLPLPPGDVEELESGPTSGGADPIDGAHLLMVEDNPVNMMIAVALLEQWGAVVGQAGDGAEAVAAVEAAWARGHPFDAVLMDVQMPGMSGYQATETLRRRFDARELPIIALTAAALVSERNRALAVGMNDFLTKPIDAQRLRHSLVRSLRARNPDGP